MCVACVHVALLPPASKVAAHRLRTVARHLKCTPIDARGICVSRRADRIVLEGGRVVEDALQHVLETKKQGLGKARMGEGVGSYSTRTHLPRAYPVPPSLFAQRFCGVR